MDETCHPCDEPVPEPKIPSCPIQCCSPKCKAYHKAVVDKAIKPVVWLLGGPGSGKGTQCERIAARYNFVHISVGELLREETKKRNSSKTNIINEIMREGGLIPNELVLEIVKERILQTIEEAPGFLVDGYPREPKQGLDFVRLISPPSVILYIEVSEATLMSRLRHRAQNPTGAPRADDHEDIFKQRIKTFLAHISQILEIHKDQIRKVVDGLRVNGEGTPEQIFIEIAKILDPIVTESEIEVERRRICKVKRQCED